MRFVSTRGGGGAVCASEAMRLGLAPDGGLYVPEAMPVRSPGELSGCETVAEIGARLLAPFFEGDPLSGELDAICREAMDFPVPLRPIGPVHLLELFWGPTAAFKDFGARFLARSFARTVHELLRIVVATSGDTGGAVAAAFAGQPGVDVVVLYPLGMVSARQEHQLCAFGGNVTALAVRGTFDDCQALAKAAFSHPAISAGRALSSANSINIGRLLPQMAYHAAAALWRWRETGAPVEIVVPSGNIGNATAALWAKHCGMPIARLVLATNANLAIGRYVATGQIEPSPTVQTLANAMDVGAPSNLERLRHLYAGRPEQIRAELAAHAVDDDAIRARIARAAREWGVALCPHTATAAEAWEALGGTAGAVLVATAHPAKFETVTEPLVGHPIEVPPALAEILARPWTRRVVEPTLEAVVAALDG